jgi:hypothetical protein
VKVTDLRTAGAQQTERSVKEFGAVCDGLTDVHVSLCQEKSARFLGALRSARVPSDPVVRLRTYASRLVVPAPRRTGHPFAASSSEKLSQMIEFVFSASPETIRKEPRKLPSSLSRSTAGPGSLRIE